MESFVNEAKRRKLDRPFTGVISEDRIWEQWYTEEAMKKPLPKTTQKRYLFSRIGDQPDRVIINNRGLKKYTVIQFENLIKEYMCAFAAAGIKKGDRVCFIGLSTPELYAMKYALTEMGGITCFLNILDVAKDDNGVNRLYEQTANANPKMIFTLDYLQDKVSKIINEPRFKDALKVTMPLDKSTPILNPERTVLALKRMRDHLTGKDIQGSISLSEFLACGKTVDFKTIESVYEEGLPCNIAFTSGTTGVNKACLLTHDANNILAFQQEIADFGYKVGSKHLTYLPPFLAFWDADIVHVTLCLGAENILELSPEAKDVVKYFKKYKGEIAIAMGPQYQQNALLELPRKELDRIIRNYDIPIIGGERPELNALETFYEQTGIRQTAGYGFSEGNTTFSYTHPDCYKPGTSGIPLPHNNVRIVTPDFKDLTYNEPGILLAHTPCLMKGYLNNPKLTDEVIFTDNKGDRWFITGDYALMDDDGVLKVLDRYKDPIVVRADNTEEEYQLLDDAEVIKQNRNVRLCKLTYNNGKIVLHLVIDSFTGLSKEEALNSILDDIKANLYEIHWPDIVHVYDELPRTYVGKVSPEIESIGEKLVADYPDSPKLTIVYAEPSKTKKKK